MILFEVRQKYSAARCIFNSLLGVSSGDETLRLMFDILLQTIAREAMDVNCLRVLKESNKRRFDSYSVRNKRIDHIPYYLSGLSRAQFLRQPF